MNKIVNIFKHIFIPHEHNDYKPHFFRELSVSIIVVVVIILFSISLGTKLYIDKTDMTAAVLPAVLVDLTNNARQSSGVVTLARSSVLDQAAQMKANDMATYGYFAHTSPQGVTPWYWFSKANYNFYYAGENLAIDFRESVDVEKAWLNSPTHKANILNDKFTEIGIATTEGSYNGHPTTYVVQMFAKPVLGAKTVPDVFVKKEMENVSLPKVNEIIKVNNLTNKVAVLPVVKGETIEINKNEKDIEIIEENNEFISVKNISNLREELVPAPKNNRVKYSNWVDRFVFLAPSYTNLAYKIIIYIVLFSLFLMMIIEIKRLHPKNIVYGILLLIIIFCLIYINRSIFLIDFLK